MIKRHKLEIILLQKGLQRAGRIFFVWSKFAKKQKTLQRLYKEDLENREKGLIEKYLATWRAKTSAVLHGRAQEVKGHYFSESSMIRRAFVGLVRNMVFKKKARVVLEEAGENLIEKRMTNAFQQLVDYMRYKQEKTQKRIKSQVFYNMNSQRKFLYIWSRYQCYKKRLSE